MSEAYGCKPQLLLEALLVLLKHTETEMNPRALTHSWCSSAFQGGECVSILNTQLLLPVVWAAQAPGVCTVATIADNQFCANHTKIKQLVHIGLVHVMG